MQKDEICTFLSVIPDNFEPFIKTDVNNLPFIYGIMYRYWKSYTINVDLFCFGIFHFLFDKLNKLFVEVHN